MKRGYVVLFSLLFGWCTLCVAALAREPGELVKTTADTVIARVKAEKATLRANPARLHALVDELIVPHFDFKRMAQWVLGKHWRGATPEQKTQFVEQFKRLLIRTYASALVEFSDHEIRYLPVRAAEGATDVTVKTEVQQEGSRFVPIVYRMQSRDADWKVIDVAVDGISLLATYRTEFSSQIQKGGMDKLITALIERNEK